MHKDAISFFRVSKAVLVFFSLAFFLIAPSIDNIACDDCASPFQGKWPDALHFCSFCYNTVGMVSYHIFNIPLVSVPIDIDRPTTAFSGPSFPIYKPPQN